MNFSVIRYILCMLVELMSALLAVPMLVCLFYGEWHDALIFATIAVLCLAFGFVFGYLKKPQNRTFYAREGFVITALAWIILSLIGAIPFTASGTIPSYLDAVFETVSGFTTTGATILVDINGLTQMHKGVQFWRCFTHWVGGMGILVFMLAILPMAGGYSMHLMKAESPGPSVGKYAPKVKDTAKILYSIYIAITLSEMICLKLTGLSVYESMTLTFSTVGTGGFGLLGSSILEYSHATQTVIIVFMALCGVNFSVYYFLLIKKFKEAWHIDEMRWYFVIMFGSAVLIAWNVVRNGVIPNFGDAFHHSLFTVTSIMTTTGFATLDYNVWPQFSRTLLFVLTCIGACAGSTGGGFKFSRIIILIRNAKNEVIKTLHPKSVQRVYMDDHVVEDATVKGTSAYLSIYTIIFLASFLLVSFFESFNVIDLEVFDFETNITAVAATLNNVGPGLNMVGPTGGFHDFSWASKIVLIFDMLAGRLELMPVLILFHAKTWRK